MEKSADAFRTISEVADDLDLPQHVLRFWETRFEQIRPLKRAGGRRYYRPADLVLLRVIRQLLYQDGYTIKGVQRLLKEQGVKTVTAGVLGGQAALEPTLDRTPRFGSDLDEEPALAAGSPLGCDGPSVERDDHVEEPPDRGDRRAISDALALIEACEAILMSVRRS